MNKKEILEIRKQFKEDRSTITRLCCCYVNHDKEKLMESAGAFLTLPEEELFKYFDIFKHTLSGTVGKNLINMESPLAQEVEGGTQHFLVRLLESKLEDEILLEEFYDKIIASYSYAENYLILVIYAAYDVPGRAKDNTEMFDASETVYSHILVSLCPVKLTKPGLRYNADEKLLENRVRDWVVENPLNGFLFPAFNDRSTDIHQALYYSAKPEEPQPDFIEQVLGSVPPLTAGSQKETFQEIVSEVLGENCGYEVLKTIHENLNEMVEANQDNPEPLELSRPDVKRLLENSGVPEENLTNFDQTFNQTAGERTTFLATNIAETRKFSVETPNIIIKADPAYADLIETRIIDGRPCLVIAVDDLVEVNGVMVRTTLPQAEPEAAAVETPWD
ncbi:MAG: DUF4317 domain-containing protein [Lachnospiraceae bacterium]|nr:DUF4317 domain-containing protein [Lachnospiraceae bacterium]